jgi:hypothetical protein
MGPIPQTVSLFVDPFLPLSPENDLYSFPSSDVNLWTRVSACTADKITWPLSVIIMERVLRPWEASTSLPFCLASVFSRFIGADVGVTMATILETATTLLNPIFTN